MGTNGLTHGKIVVCLAVVLIGIGQVSRAGTHVEDFSEHGYQTGDWMKFSVDMPLDNMPETPNTVIRSAYDWTKGWPAQGSASNEQWPAENWPVMMVAGNSGNNPSYEEYYLSAPGNQVRWEQATLVSYNQTTCDITVSVIASDSTVLFSQDIFPGGQDTVVTLDFGELPYDGGTMTLRVADYAADQGQRIAYGYWGIDDLIWSETTGEPNEPNTIPPGTTVLDFSEFTEEIRVDWNAYGYADNMPNTPDILSETWAGPIWNLEVMLDFGGHSVPQYPILSCIGDKYPDRSGSVEQNPYTEYYRFYADPNVNPAAVVVIESFDLYFYPGSYENAGLRLWITDAGGATVWGPFEVVPPNPAPGAWWHFDVPGTVHADSSMTLWLQDIDSTLPANLRAGYWGLDNLTYSNYDSPRPDPPCGCGGQEGKLLADLNGDCYVDMQDFAAFSQDWLAAGTQSPADINQDGTVNSVDFAILASLWGRCDAEADADCSCLQCSQVDAGAYHYPSFNKVMVGFSAPGCGGAGSPLTAVASLTKNTQAEVLVRGQTDFTEDSVELELSTAGLEPGDYRVEAMVFEDQAPVLAKTFDLTIQPEPAWLGNQIGVLPAGTVPAPWTAMTVNGGDINCWGRTYRFANTVFPSQIETAGAQILYWPIRLSGVVNSISRALSAGSVSITSQADDRVELITSGFLGELPVQASIWIEYDGLCWITMELLPEAPVEISSLRLEIRLNDENATLFCSDHPDLDGTGKVLSSWSGEYSYSNPQFWIGDEQRGLYWGAESNRNWMLDNPSQGIRYDKLGDQVLVTVTLIDHQVTISEPTSYQFGLMATPVRPKPAGWRTWRFGKAEDPPYTTAYYQYSNMAIIDYWCIRQRSVTPIPHATTPARVAGFLSQGLQPVPYMSLTWTDPQSPEYLYYRDEWHDAYYALPDSNDPDPTAWRQVAVCANAQSFQDWFLWTVTDTISSLDLHAMYFDMSAPSTCANHGHGCGFQDPNRTWPEPFGGSIYGPTSPEARYIDSVGQYFMETHLLRTREMARRFYLATQQHDPNFVSVFHTSGSLYLPQIAYLNAVLEGEQFRRPPVNYYNVIRLDQFRAEFMGHNWGFVGVFLPEFAAAADRAGEDPNFWYTSAAAKQVRHLLGMILVHDSQVWPAYSTEVPYNQIRAAQDQFGWDDSLEFLPYWDNASYVTITPANENLVVSVFRDPARTKAMLVVFNNTDSNIDSTISLNFSNLGVSGTTLRDPINGETFPIANSQASVFMPYRDFRILFLE